MKLRLLILVMLNLVFFEAGAQLITYKLRFRNSDKTPVINTSFLVADQRLDTDPQGIILLKLPQNVTQVNVRSADLKSYIINNNLTETISLPKDPGITIDVYVSKPTPDQLKLLEGKIDKSQSALRAYIQKNIQETKAGYDKILALINSSNFNDTTIMRGQLEFYPLISSTLLNYLNEARNFNDAFLALSSALNTKPAYNQLSDAIYRYNDIFDLLNKNKSTYEQAIATYWKSQELALKYSNVIDYAIEDFHKIYILEINYTYINRIYAAVNETNKKKRARLQQDLAKDMQELSAAMSRKLTGLGERITSINSRLYDNDRKSNDVTNN
ncbi:hypothetical protein [Mucilaginibacter pocheonensis]|uniref:Tetratricopeptide (TPR) repeat protein n=1 Tax=Mucilaginibacter pocheonensis TaxID=398050 RepID=A0ABU1T6H3_9SPHI|nr:hypothetical protein [Mucilaginibacter pocheonensis]MDR6940501.1 tetratricopeptide (TPR) repeat protein [Mucilaginibacter pocheonensis]